MATDDSEHASALSESSAATVWGRTVQDFLDNPGAWLRVSAHAERATARAYRGGASVEEVFEKAGVILVRHRVIAASGTIVHETFRPYSKFGPP